MNKNEWETKKSPDDGTWCWVSNGTDVWPAMADKSAKNGWTNKDTWEDFGGQVKCWIPLVAPEPPKTTS